MMTVINADKTYLHIEIIFIYQGKIPSDDLSIKLILKDISKTILTFFATMFMKMLQEMY